MVLNQLHDKINRDSSPIRISCILVSLAYFLVEWEIDNLLRGPFLLLCLSWIQMHASIVVTQVDWNLVAILIKHVFVFKLKLGFGINSIFILLLQFDSIQSQKWIPSNIGIESCLMVRIVFKLLLRRLSSFLIFLILFVLIVAILVLLFLLFFGFRISWVDHLVILLLIFLNFNSFCHFCFILALFELISYNFTLKFGGFISQSIYFFFASIFHRSNFLLIFFNWNFLFIFNITSYLNILQFILNILK